MNNDDALMQAKAGDPSAIGSVLNKYKDLLLDRAGKKLDKQLQSRIRESDLVQDTFFAATKGFSGFQGQTQAELVAWLKAILDQQVAVAAREHLLTKKRSAGKEVTPRRQLEGSQLSSNSVFEPEAKASTASRHMMRKELRERLEIEINSLPQEQQEAVRRKYIEQQTLAEIAEILGKTERAVAGLIFRGTERLKDVLTDLK